MSDWGWDSSLKRGHFRSSTLFFSVYSSILSATIDRKVSPHACRRRWSQSQQRLPGIVQRRRFLIKYGAGCVHFFAVVVARCSFYSDCLERVAWRTFLVCLYCLNSTSQLNGNRVVWLNGFLPLFLFLLLNDASQTYLAYLPRSSATTDAVAYIDTRKCVQYLIWLKDAWKICMKHRWSSIFSIINALDVVFFLYISRNNLYFLPLNEEME